VVVLSSIGNRILEICPPQIAVSPCSDAPVDFFQDLWEA
jgi:hypothetical protein